ncbi:MAG: multidrug transporter [Piscirickettsiaceae bacterium]|nr:MAG: multidrug transporter [Piscirickettsiaceae bacterium]
MIDKLSSFIARKPVFVAILLTIITIIPGYYAYKGLSLKVVLEEMLPANSNNVELFLRFGEQFGGANTTLIEIKNKKGNIYNLEFLEKYKQIAEDVYYNEDTYRHLSQSLVLRKTKAISGGGGRVGVDALMWPDLPKNEKDMTRLRQFVNKQYRGIQVSNDETSAIVIADFRDEVDKLKVLNFFLDLREKYEGDDLDINFVGRPILLGYIYQSLDSVFNILASSILIIAIILFLYFRTWVGVFVPMFTATVATIWGLGGMGFIGYNLDPLLILLPAFIFAIVLSHGVQFTTRILDNIAACDERPKDSRECTRDGLALLLVPSTAAIITDAAGFGVLALVAIPSIESLAVICSLWLLSVIPALIFAASVMCLIKPPKSHKTGSIILNKIWGAVINMEDHAWTMMFVTALLLGTGVWYAGNLTVGDTKGSAILWPEARFNQDVESINTRFSFLGTDMVQVYVEGEKDTMLDPTVYHQTEAMDRYIFEHMPEVRPAISLVPIIKLINSVLYEGDPSYALIPDTQEAVGFDIYMFRSRGEPGDFAAYTNKKWEIGNISFFLEDHSRPTIQKLRDNLDGFFANKNEVVSDAKFLYMGGQVGIVEALNEEIVRSNVKTMVAIAFVIFFCIVLYYRSVTTGLILLFSLATANSLTYAFMAWKEVGLNVSTLPLAALGVGLGVDYGIYMIDRIKEEYQKLEVKSVHEAVHHAFLTAGNAIFITAVTMIAPLIPWAVASPLRFQAEMGMLLAMVLFMNMLGSLLFVPAALTAFRPKALFKDS